jgi:structural maintenance of chromosome 4
VPDSTIVVARTAYTNNSSKYTINGGASTFTDVRALLLGRGIDLQHKRFLILQGEVESIALMKPKGAGPHDEGLLEYLEDIIGTAGYQAPIAAALAALDALAEERADKLARLRITERERAALAAEKREAEEHLRLVNAHTRAQSRLWQWYIWRAFTNLDVYQANIAATEAALAELREQNKGDLDHLTELQDHYQEREAQYEVGAPPRRPRRAPADARRRK